MLGLLLLSLSAGRSGAGQAEGVRPQDLPPAARLGLRVEAIRAGTRALQTVVIVPDSRSFIGAISHWRPERRFPVLIDDGSVRAREDIARFVRAYAPLRVVRWEDPSGADRGSMDQRRARVESALSSAWGLGAQTPISDVYALWRNQPQYAPGVVVTHAGDPALPAALALAAFRAQPIVWAGAPRNPDGMMTREQIDALASEIETGVASLLMPWRDLGDQIDAITLCLSSPAKFDAGTDDKGARITHATTDRIGRLADDLKGEKRWAWCSQVIGSESACAYQAMCALFLRPTTAWLFDGYEDDPRYNDYDLAPADDVLREGAFQTRLITRPSNTRDNWLVACARALDAGLILVNSHGMRDVFHASGRQRLRPGDLPILGHPAMVHFIHSWSAVQPAQRSTIAGRFLERGAYAYLGSVQEPFLQAFVPSEGVVRRMRGAYPWAASVRFDAAPVWKLACFGDPLITLGAALTRLQEPPSLEGALDLESRMRDAARGERFAEALDHLSLLGRDADAARLLLALERDRPAALTPEVARAGVMSMARAAPPEDFFRVYARLSDDDGRDPARLDALWNLVRLRLNAAGEDDRPMLAFLRDHLREDQRAEDARELSRAIARVEGTPAALAFLNSIAPADKRDEETLNEAKRRLLNP